MINLFSSNPSYLALYSLYRILGLLYLSSTSYLFSSPHGLLVENEMIIANIYYGTLLKSSNLEPYDRQI